MACHTAPSRRLPRRVAASVAAVRCCRRRRRIISLVVARSKPPRFAHRGERQRVGAASDREQELHHTGPERIWSFKDLFCEREFLRSRQFVIGQRDVKEVARSESAPHGAVFVEPHEEVERLGFHSKLAPAFFSSTLRVPSCCSKT